MDPFAWEIRILTVIANMSTLLFNIFVLLIAMFGLKTNGQSGEFLTGMAWIGVFSSLFCCAALMRQSLSMIWTYIAIMVLIVIGDFILLVTVHSARDLNDALLLELNKTSLTNSEKLEIAQTVYYCCGMDGPEDYEKIGLELPESCYSKKISDNRKLYTKGCRADMERTIQSFVKCIVAVMWINLLLENQFTTTLLCAVILIRNFIADQF